MFPFPRKQTKSTTCVALSSQVDPIIEKTEKHASMIIIYLLLTFRYSYSSFTAKQQWGKEKQSPKAMLWSCAEPCSPCFLWSSGKPHCHLHLVLLLLLGQPSWGTARQLTGKLEGSTVGAACPSRVGAQGWKALF